MFYRSRNINDDDKTLTFRLDKLESGDKFTVDIERCYDVSALKFFIWREKLGDLRASFNRMKVVYKKDGENVILLDNFRFTPENMVTMQNGKKEKIEDGEISVIIDDLNVDLDNLSGRKVDLTGEDLSGKDLSGKDLRYIKLSRANLENANLSGADLSGVNLYATNLKNANLEGANLESCKIRESDLENANLRKANLRKANIEHTILRGANFQGANLQSCFIESADLHLANFDNIPTLFYPT